MINEPLLIPCYLLKSVLYIDLLSFSLMSFFWSSIPPKSPITVRHHVSRGSFWLWVSQTFFGSDDLDNLGEIECPSLEIDLMLFSQVDCGHGLGRGRPHGLTPFHHIMSRVHAVIVTYHCRCWQKSCLPGVSTLPAKVPFLPFWLLVNSFLTLLLSVTYKVPMTSFSAWIWCERKWNVIPI